MLPFGIEPGSGSNEDHEPDRLMILSGSQAHYLYIGSEPVSLTPEENTEPNGVKKQP